MSTTSADPVADLLVAIADDAGEALLAPPEASALDELAKAYPMESLGASCRAIDAGSRLSDFEAILAEDDDLSKVIPGRPTIAR